MATGAGVAVIPWYATVFRGDRLEAVVNEIAPVALRYGATEFEVLRSREDRYRFRQSATFERKIDFERYWYGPEFAAFRLLQDLRRRPSDEFFMHLGEFARNHDGAFRTQFADHVAQALADAVRSLVKYFRRP